MSYTPQFPFGADAYQGIGAAPHDGAPSMDDLHDLPDLVNAALYLYEGDTTNAAWSAAAAVFDVAIGDVAGSGVKAAVGNAANVVKPACLAIDYTIRRSRLPLTKHP